MLHACGQLVCAEAANGVKGSLGVPQRLPDSVYAVCQECWQVMETSFQAVNRLGYCIIQALARRDVCMKMKGITG